MNGSKSTVWDRQVPRIVFLAVLIRFNRQLYGAWSHFGACIKCLGVYHRMLVYLVIYDSG